MVFHYSLETTLQRFFLLSVWFSQALLYVRHMKTAFVHDRIAHEWWAESVLRSLISDDSHDEWIIFTYYSTQTWRRVGEKKYRIITALPRRLNKRFITCNTRRFIVLSTLFDYRNLMFRFPHLTRRLSRKIRSYAPDHIIISSFAAAKNINTTIAPTTLYLHSPMQYIRENYYENLHKLHFPIKQLYQIAAQFLRPWDKKKRRYDHIYFNSEYTQLIAGKLYWLQWTVKYPPIDKVFRSHMNTHETHSYYIFMWRVVRYVREIDKIIRLFNNTWLPLLIVGDGPDMWYAQSIAWSNIMFTWRVDDPEEKKRLLAHACWYINLAKESFGIWTAEALCAGVPVFGFNGWASSYLIHENNGYLVDDKDDESLEKWFKIFREKDYNRKRISEEAQKKFFS